MKLYIKKGDTVKVITGNDRGKTGKVIGVDTANGKVIVEKVHVVKKHTKPSNTNPTGGVIEKTLPVSASNVLLFCKNCNKAVRPGFRFMEDGSKVRYCRKCNEVIE
ncbi:MAG: 50S ribosomal protein L24 [Deltaproteobacteria bacterium]|nr:50S ribosomal protein L24 [Deltaproteobacteria bacterium]